jgi:hypothetical protein
MTDDQADQIAAAIAEGMQAIADALLSGPGSSLNPGAHPGDVIAIELEAGLSGLTSAIRDLANAVREGAA